MDKTAREVTESPFLRQNDQWPGNVASGPESGGTAVPGVEWKGLKVNELLKVLWAILLKAHFVMRYLLVRYVFTLFRRVRLDFPVIPGLTGNLVHRLS